MNKKEIVYLSTLITGILMFAFGLTHDFLGGAMIHYGTYDTFLIIVGAIIAIAVLALFNIERYVFKSESSLYKSINILTVLLFCCLIISTTSCGYLYGQLQQMEKEKTAQESPFFVKKVIIRNDDVGGKVDPALEWLTNLTIEKDIKVTYAVIPAVLQNHPETIRYLNDLDRAHFEMATHGYHHIHFGELPYEEQYSLIEKGTKIMEENLHVKPYTFIPPYGSSDVNTTRACMILGYHSITDMRSRPSYITDFISDFSWESNWSIRPVSHNSYQEFKNRFDEFYNSSDEFFVDLLHHGTFYDESGQLNETLVNQFEKSIDYMKNKNIEFVTIEQAYQACQQQVVCR